MNSFVGDVADTPPEDPIIPPSALDHLDALDLQAVIDQDALSAEEHYHAKHQRPSRPKHSSSRRNFGKPKKPKSKRRKPQPKNTFCSLISPKSYVDAARGDSSSSASSENTSNTSDFGKAKSR